MVGTLIASVIFFASTAGTHSISTMLAPASASARASAMMRSASDSLLPCTL
ncbi:hypothetical protein D3C78_1799770 [compost metagenome]